MWQATLIYVFIAQQHTFHLNIYDWKSINVPTLRIQCMYLLKNSILKRESNINREILFIFINCFMFSYQLHSLLKHCLKFISYIVIY